MSERGSFDDYRDLLDGRLDPAEAARLRALINADPALSTGFDAYAPVHAATGADAPAPATSLTFERLDAARRASRIRRLAPWMAAAAALLLVAVGVAALRPSAPRTLALKAIPLLPAAIPAGPEVAMPALLADWRPVADGKVRWLASVDEGRAVARVVGRPMLLWVYYPSCPVCVEWDRNSFGDEEVQRLAGEFVPVRLNAEKAPPEILALFKDDFMANWPYLAALDEEGATFSAFPGEQSATAQLMRANLTKALAMREARPAPPAWADVSAAYAATARGEQALTAGDVGGAWREFDGVRTLHVSDTLSAAARRRLAEIEKSASDALFAAMKTAATDEEAGARSLSAAAERFRGTPYGTDLAEVEQELRATGRLPVLVHPIEK